MASTKEQRALARERSKTSENSVSVLTKWLGIFSEHYGKEISAVNAAIYERALSDIGPDQLETICLKALTECRFMPTVADIRKHIQKAQEVELDTECNDEWSRILSEICLWDEYYGRWGSGGTPSLSAAGHRAVRCCGGFTAIQQTEPKHLPLLKKTFDEAYHRFHDHIENQNNRLLDQGDSAGAIVEHVTRMLGASDDSGDVQ